MNNLLELYKKAWTLNLHLDKEMHIHINIFQSSSFQRDTGIYELYISINVHQLYLT